MVLVEVGRKKWGEGMWERGGWWRPFVKTALDSAFS